MVEKFALVGPVLAAAALSCGGPQLKKPSEAEIAQCTTLEQALKALGANEQGVQPDGSVVDCKVTQEERVLSASGGYMFSEGGFSSDYDLVVDAYLDVISSACEQTIEEGSGCVVEFAGDDNSRKNLSLAQLYPPFQIKCPNVIARGVACPPVKVKHTFLHCAKKVPPYGAREHVRCVRAKGKVR
jgi:hypothetical protein